MIDFNDAGPQVAQLHGGFDAQRYDRERGLMSVTQHEVDAAVAALLADKDLGEQMRVILAAPNGQQHLARIVQIVLQAVRREN